MAIAMLRKSAPTDTLPKIPDIRSDSGFAQKASLLDALQEKRRALNDLIALLELENYLGARQFDKKSTTHAELRERLRWLRARVAVNESSKPAAATDAHPAIAEALELLRDERLKPKPNTAEQLAKARDDLVVVERAIGAQAEVVEQHRGELGYALAQRLAKHNDMLVVAHYRAAQELVRATDAVRDLHKQFVTGGYGNPRSDLMAKPLLAGALALGSDTDWNSQLGNLRRQLESKGII